MRAACQDNENCPAGCFLYASRGRSVICGGGHAVRGETGKWHDLRGVWGHAVRGGEGVWHDL